MRSLRVSHIVLSTQEVADLLMGQFKGVEDKELKTKLFCRLAKKYSACNSRKKGGDIGWIDAGTNAPELEEAVQKASLGKVDGPVKTRYGYHIFMITEEAEMLDTGIDGITVGTLR
jgi:parvulin-like peptidyl-prolyl isomerase